MNKMLIATDYDGTLNRNGCVAEDTRSAIDQWREAGGYFGIVTGRSADFYDLAVEQGLPFDYLILCNGSLVLAQDKTVLFESLIPPETFAALEDAMAGYADVIGYSKCGESRQHYYAVFPDQERALQVREELLPAFGDKVSIFVNGQHINIGNRGTGKAEGVAFILRHYGLPPDSAAAVGDDYNDLDMILAHNGWAVASGRPQVVSAAPHVCRDVGELIRTLLSNREEPLC